MKNVMHRILFTCVLASAFVASAAEWPDWRGPFYNGSTTETGLPDTFSKTDHVKWVAEFPGTAASTPIIWGDKVFVSATDETTKTLLAYCLNRKDGSVLWKREVGVGISRDSMSNFASPSPSTDGKLVVFFFGDGNLMAFDYEGKQLWSRNIQKDYGDFAFQWTFSSSPLLYEGRLYLQDLQRNQPVNGRGRTDGPIESFLLALNPETGREIWRQVRSSEAKMESHEAYSTPLPYEHAGRKEIVVAGGDCLTGHDPETGRELWRWGTWNPTRINHWRLVSSPVEVGSVILVCGPKGAPVFAVKAGLNGSHEDDGLAWQSKDREVSTDVSTPLYYGGSAYVLNSDRKVLIRLEPATGRVVWQGELDSRSKFEASPLGADGKIYLMNHDGRVYVAKAGGEAFSLIHAVDMGDAGDRELRTSIVAAHGELFVRTGHKLFCLAN